MKSQTAAAAVVLILSSPAWADDPCETQRNTLEINACAKQQFDAQDKLLNASYQALIKALSKRGGLAASDRDPKALLVKAQRLWVQFREADCQAKYQVYAGGTIRSAVYLGCMRERTEQRIKELSSSDWQGG